MTQQGGYQQPPPQQPPPPQYQQPPPQQQQYQQPPPQQYQQPPPGYGPQSVQIPPQHMKIIAFGIVAGILVLIGMSIDWYDHGSGWDLADAFGSDGQFAYLYAVAIFAILGLVFAIIIPFVRMSAFKTIILVAALLAIILPLVAWLHGYAWHADQMSEWQSGYNFGDAMDDMGIGVGWIIAMVGGIFFFITYMQIKKAIAFPMRGPRPQYQQPPPQQQYQQQPPPPPQQPPPPPQQPPPQQPPPGQ